MARVQPNSISGEGYNGSEGGVTTALYRNSRCSVRLSVLGSLLVAIALLVVFMPNPTLAQIPVCDPGIRASEDEPHPYRLRDGRCEGFYAKPVSSGTLRLVSLVEFFSEYTLGKDKEFILEWRAPEKQSVRLRAQGIKPRLYYRMDAMAETGTSLFAWPLDILAVREVPASDLGLTAWVQVGQQEAVRDVYLPLVVRTSEMRSAAKQYDVTLISDVELSAVYVSLARSDSQGEAADFVRDAVELGYQYYPAERPIVFSIPFSDLQETGVFYLEIGARLKAGPSTVLQEWFYHVQEHVGS